MRGQGPLTLWFDGKFSNTTLTKILDLICFRFRRKKIFPHFFNITSMGKKLISKDHLTPAPPPFPLRFRLKVDKNQAMILGMFQSGSRPGTWCSRWFKFSKEEHH